jgi:hypothetical protein
VAGPVGRTAAQLKPSTIIIATARNSQGFLSAIEAISNPKPAHPMKPETDRFVMVSWRASAVIAAATTSTMMVTGSPKITAKAIAPCDATVWQLSVFRFSSRSIGGHAMRGWARRLWRRREQEASTQGAPGPGAPAGRTGPGWISATYVCVNG